jgi:hypothetical protein
MIPIRKNPAKKDMTFHEAQYYHNLHPHGDIDRDGVPNYADCRPFDPNRQGIFKRATGILTKDKYGQTAEEYEAEKQQKALVKAQLAELKAQSQQSDLPLKETGPTLTAKQWLERQSQRDIPIGQTIQRAIPPTKRALHQVEQTVSPYVTGEEWPDPPLFQSHQQEEEYYRQLAQLQQPPQRGPRMRQQQGGSYYGRKGYMSFPPSREPTINIFRDSPSPRPINIFKQSKRYRRR